MEFLIKKGSSKKTTVSYSELTKKLDLANLQKQIVLLKRTIEELKDEIVKAKEELLNKTDLDFLKKGEVINIAHASNIEKLNSLKAGSLYCNFDKKTVRLKTEEGWVTILKIK